MSVAPAVDGHTEGMSREVFALLESGELPPVVPAQPVSVFKERRNLGKGQGWQWRPFANAARTDGLMLHHWAKASEDLGGMSVDLGGARRRLPALRSKGSGARRQDGNADRLEW